MKREQVAEPGWRYPGLEAGIRRALAAKPMILVLQGKREGMEIGEEGRLAVQKECAGADNGNGEG